MALPTKDLPKSWWKAPLRPPLCRIPSHPLLHPESPTLYSWKEVGRGGGRFHDHKETFSIGSQHAFGASLVAQWLRIHLPMQGTRVQSLIQEDPTCRGASKSVHHNYWGCGLEPTSHNYWAHAPQLLKPTHLESVLCNKRGHRNEKPAHPNEE